MTSINLPPAKYLLLSVPAPHVLLMTINLAKQMNSLPAAAVWEMHEIWEWFDQEPELYVPLSTLSLPTPCPSPKTTF
jgi:enoyl-CoA hydratase/carnithine racemase